MTDQGALFDGGGGRSWGRMRRALELEVKLHREQTGTTAKDDGLPASLLAGLRHLADQVDALARSLAARGLEAKAYDRQVMAVLQRQYDETYRAVFGGAASDPLDDAIADLMRAEAGDTAHP